MKALSDFCRRMQESLERYEKAQTPAEKQAARDEMARIIKHNVNRKAPQFDPKAAAAGPE